MMYYSHKLRIANPGVSWSVSGVEKLVKSMIFVGLTIQWFYDIINTNN
jgi:hypothetical protein